MGGGKSSHNFLPGRKVKLCTARQIGEREREGQKLAERCRQRKAFTEHSMRSRQRKAFSQKSIRSRQIKAFI